MAKTERMISLISTTFFFLLIIFTITGNLKYTPVVSSELKTRITETSTQKRTDYIDSSGEITFATDKGFATIIKIIDNGLVILEKYLDEQGNIVNLSAGYAQIRRFYDNGLNTKIDYLDDKNNSVVIKKGYNSVHRSYNLSGLADTDTFWIGDTQIEHSNGYWQYQRLYTSGKISELRYLDQNGKLVNTLHGYALVYRTYDGDSTIDLYYDSDMNPVSSSLGQYGKKTEKVNNGRITTYLGSDGKVENTIKGYAIVKKYGTKTLYYDKNGEPSTIGRNQYGIENIGGQRVYLDKDGNPMFRLDNLLQNKPILVLVFGILATVMGALLQGKVRLLFYILYVCFIFTMTIAFRENGNLNGQFELFYSFKKFFSSPVTRRNILNNIWLFVPLGAVLYNPDHQYLWILAIVLSLFIEIVQLVWGIGVCEIDDIISNGTGALIGVGIALSIERSLMLKKTKEVDFPRDRV